MENIYDLAATEQPNPANNSCNGETPRPSSAAKNPPPEGAPQPAPAHAQPAALPQAPISDVTVLRVVTEPSLDDGETSDGSPERSLAEGARSVALNQPDVLPRSGQGQLEVTPGTPPSGRSSLGRQGTSTSSITSQRLEALSPDPHSPVKSVPKASRNRNLKFHKLFKSMPEEEVVINAYSCAYVGDILWQGNLYISPKWFCFHSKILGREKRIVLGMDSVLNITREKTALFIPNAVGVITQQDKYVFGSLMSRDNTHRLMLQVWNAFKSEEPPPEESDDDNEEGSGNEQGRKLEDVSAGPEETTDSECSGLCIQCSQTVSLSQQTAHVHDLEQRGRLRTGSQSYSSAVHGLAGPPHSQSAHSLASNRYEQRKLRRELSASLQQQEAGQSRSRLFLTVSSLITLTLLVVAVVQVYRIDRLQAQLDSSDVTWERFTADPNLYSHKSYGDLYYLNNRFHMATLERLHSVLQANIVLLQQMFSSLQSLQKNSPFLRQEYHCRDKGKCDT